MRKRIGVGRYGRGGVGEVGERNVPEEFRLSCHDLLDLHAQTVSKLDLAPDVFE